MRWKRSTAAGLDVADFEDGDVALAYVQAHAEAVCGRVHRHPHHGGDRRPAARPGHDEAHPAVTVVVTSGQFAERPVDLGPRIVYIGKPWMAIDVLNAIIDAKQDDD